MGRVVIVTGGASGMGLASAQRLARKGYRVAILDLNLEAAEKYAAELVAEGHESIGLQVDVAERASVDAAVARVKQTYGPTEILVHSAGITDFTPFLEITDEKFARLLSVNLWGSWNMAQAVAPDMIAAGWGRICMMSSSSTQTGAPKMAAYITSKGGVIGLTKALASELGQYGITSNHIPPGSIVTPMSVSSLSLGNLPDLEELGKRLPVRRIGQPEDIAAAVEYVVSDDAGYLTGQSININGGRFYG